MQLQDITHRFLQTISVVICLVDLRTGCSVSQNETFHIWFDTAQVGVRFEDVLSVPLPALAQGEPMELRTKVKRRTVVIELSAHQADHLGTPLLVIEAQNI